MGHDKSSEDIDKKLTAKLESFDRPMAEEEAEEIRKRRNLSPETKIYKTREDLLTEIEKKDAAALFVNVARYIDGIQKDEIIKATKEIEGKLAAGGRFSDDVLNNAAAHMKRKAIVRSLEIITAGHTEEYTRLETLHVNLELAKRYEAFEKLEAELNSVSNPYQLQHYLPPTTYTMPDHKLANILSDPAKKIIDAGPFNILVSERNRPEIKTYVIVSTDNNENMKIAGNYTAFDREVSNAITSIYMDKNNDNTFTYAQLCRVITGTSESVTPSSELMNSVKASVEKQRGIRVELNATEEARAYARRHKLSEQEANKISFKINDTLLSIRGIEVEAGGNIVEGGYIKEPPLTLQYSKINDQLITVNSKLLDIKEVDKNGKITDTSVDNTEARIVMRGYLLRRIQIMKNDEKNAREALRQYNNRQANKKKEDRQEKTITDFRKREQNRKILFDTLFKATGLTTDSRETQRRNRNYCYSALDYWAACGYIKGYAIAKGKQGRHEGIEIKL